MNLNKSTKKCPKCEKDKLLTLEFWYNNPKRINGFDNICKKCRYIVLKEFSNKNKERNNHAFLAGRLEDPAKKKCCCRCKKLKPLTFQFWRKEMAGKDGFTARCKKCDKDRNIEYYNREKDNISKRQKEIPSYVFRHVKNMARKRNLKFEIDLEYYKINLFKMPCYYCGGRTKGWLDRKNNNKKLGYTVDNVVSCCEDCNRAKGVMTVDEFLSHVFRIVEHAKKHKNL